MAARDVHYRAIIEDLPGLVCRFEPGGIITFVNRAYCEYFGKTPDELVGRPFLELIPEADRGQVMANLAQLTIDAPVQTHEHRVISRDGQTRWQRWTNRALFDENGRINAYQSVGVDVTEQRRAECTLRITQFTVDRAADAVFWITPDARFHYVNEMACQALGYSRDELLSMTVHDIDPDFPPDTWQDHWQELKTRKTLTIESRHRTKQGRVFPVEVSLRLLEFEGQEYNIAFARDITDRKLAEAALQESRRTLATLMSNLPGMAYRCLNDADWTMLFVSDGCELLTGYKPEQLVQNRALSYAEIIHPEDGQAVWEQVQEAIAADRPFRLTYRITTRAGKRRWVWEQGRQTGVTEDGMAVLEGFIADITQQREAERALRESELRFRTLFDYGHDGILLADPETWQLAMPNPAMCHMLGYTPSQIADMTVADIHPEESLAYVVGEFEKQDRGETTVAKNIPVKRKDGSVFVADVSSASIFVDGQRYLLGQFHDITEHRRVQEELRERVRQLSALNDLSRRVSSRLELDEVARGALEGIAQQIQADLVLIFLRRDGELDLAGARPDLSRFGGRTLPVHRVGQCLCGLAVSQRLPVYSQDIRDDPRCTWRECKQAGLRSFAALPLVSGEEVFGVVGVASESIRDFAREAAFLETLANEVAIALHNARLYDQLRRRTDELAEANRQIRRLNVELEKRVAQRTAELEGANEELRAFAYSVSHDLRAPLRAMEGFAKALTEDFAPILGPEGAEYCRHIEDSAARLDALIRDLLAYSRLGRTALHVQPVSLQDVIADAMAELQSDICDRRARVAVDDDIPDVIAHRSTLVQVVLNLLSNALKFTAAEVRPEVRIRAERRDGAVRLWIEDNGIGIDPQYQERIFRPFERLHGIERYAGTGIGLAIVGRAMTRLGGRCGVESRPGEGSHFWIELPKAGTADAQREPDDPDRGRRSV